MTWKNDEHGYTVLMVLSATSTTVHPVSLYPSKSYHICYLHYSFAYGNGCLDHRSPQTTSWMCFSLVLYSHSLHLGAFNYSVGASCCTRVVFQLLLLWSVRNGASCLLFLAM